MLGRWVGFGIVGATALAIGIVLYVVGLLRLLQDVGDDILYRGVVDRADLIALLVLVA